MAALKFSDVFKIMNDASGVIQTNESNIDMMLPDKDNFEVDCDTFCLPLFESMKTGDFSVQSEYFEESDAM